MLSLNSSVIADKIFWYTIAMCESCQRRARSSACGHLLGVFRKKSEKTTLNTTLYTQVWNIHGFARKFSSAVFLHKSCTCEKLDRQVCKTLVCYS